MEINEASQRRTGRLLVAIEGAPDGDREELAQLTDQLRHQLLELDVDDVRLMHQGEIPSGAKAADPLSIGALMVTVAPPAIQAVIRLMQHWVRDRPVSSIKVTLGSDSLELTNASPEQVEQLTRAFVTRQQTS